MNQFKANCKARILFYSVLKASITNNLLFVFTVLKKRDNF